MLKQYVINGSCNVISGRRSSSPILVTCARKAVVEIKNILLKRQLYVFRVIQIEVKLLLFCLIILAVNANCHVLIRGIHDIRQGI